MHLEACSAFRSYVVGVFLLMAGCAGPAVPLNTESRRPEVTIQSVPLERIKSALLNKVINLGFRLAVDTPLALTFDKTIENLFQGAVLSDAYSGQPLTRLTFTFAQTRDKVRVVSDVAFVGANGQRFEGTRPGQDIAINVLYELVGELTPNPANAAK